MHTPTALAVLAAVAALTPTATATSYSPAESAAHNGLTCKVRQACPHEGTTYRVGQVITSKTVVGNNGATATTRQTFVTMTIRLTNTTGAVENIRASRLIIRGHDGHRYFPTSLAVKLNGNGPHFFPPGFIQYLGPHWTRSVLMLYQLPPAATHGAVLEIRGSTADEATILLGL